MAPEYPAIFLSKLSASTKGTLTARVKVRLWSGEPLLSCIQKYNVYHVLTQVS